jgi:hypothetical protein
MQSLCSHDVKRRQPSIKPFSLLAVAKQQQLECCLIVPVCLLF